MCKQNSTLSSYFPDAASQGNGIFSEMVSYGAPWGSGIGMDMDMLYFGYHSGIKCPSMFIENLSNNGLANRQLVARLLYDMFGLAWTNLWNVMRAEYEPLQTYRLTEEIDRAQMRTTDYTRTDAATNSYSDDNTLNSEVKSTGAVTVTIEANATHSQYGFNSSEAVPTNTNTEGSTHTTENDLADTTESTTTTKGDNSTSLSRNDIGKEGIEEGITRTKFGNTGQHTTQELLRQEFNLWRWNFYRQVFKDVDSVIALLII